MGAGIIYILKMTLFWKKISLCISRVNVDTKSLLSLKYHRWVSFIPANMPSWAPTGLQLGYLLGPSWGPSVFFRCSHVGPNWASLAQLMPS